MHLYQRWISVHHPCRNQSTGRREFPYSSNKGLNNQAFKRCEEIVQIRRPDHIAYGYQRRISRSSKRNRRVDKVKASPSKLRLQDTSVGDPKFSFGNQGPYGLQWMHVKLGVVVAAVDETFQPGHVTEAQKSRNDRYELMTRSETDPVSLVSQGQ